MNELRAEHLQPFSQFFDVMLNVFFQGGGFMKAVADMNVHEHLKLADGARQPVLSKLIVHPQEKCKSGIARFVNGSEPVSGAWQRVPLGKTYLHLHAAPDIMREP